MVIEQPSISDLIHSPTKMNSTNISDGITGANSMTGFSYGIGLSVGILLLIVTIIAVISIYCARAYCRPSRQAQELQIPPHLHQPSSDSDPEVGLDETTLSSYPKLLYSHAKLQDKHTSSSCCSICLSDYKDNDMLRLLPDCGHLFHVKCVDAWLRLHPTCPVCRTSPLITPLSTPLAEVVPFASRV